VPDETILPGGAAAARDCWRARDDDNIDSTATRGICSGGHRPGGTQIKLQIAQGTFFWRWCWVVVNSRAALARGGLMLPLLVRRLTSGQRRGLDRSHGGFHRLETTLLFLTVPVVATFARGMNASA
jgi:hypothetical protein